MGQIEKTVEYTRTIEEILTQSFGAQGKGLHQEVTSVQCKLTEPLVKKLRYIASVRNRMMHSQYVLDEPETFYATCEQAIHMLKERLEQIQANPSLVRPGWLAFSAPPRGWTQRRVLVAAAGVLIAIGALLSMQHGFEAAWKRLAPPVTHSYPALSDPPVRPIVAAASIPRAQAAHPVQMSSPLQVASPVQVAHRVVSQQTHGLSRIPTQVVSLVPNQLITLSGGRLSKTSDFFAGTAFVVTGTVTDVGPHGLTYIETRADVYAPSAKRWIRGISQMILLPRNGLAPGQSLPFSVRLGGSFASSSLAVPDVENDPGLKVRLQVINGTDRMGDTLSPTGVVVARNG